ncbi:MAG: hypothetical protein J0H86_22560, partial [Xanthomonadaceae bacterium]|nr:hypothetical protein [Xanthomonadaceae bacterium]
MSVAGHSNVRCTKTIAGVVEHAIHAKEDLNKPRRLLARRLNRMLVVMKIDAKQARRGCGGRKLRPFYRITRSLGA